METLKQQIAILANEQHDIKLQRKTVNFTGTRVLTPREAQYKAQDNSYKLRQMYVALGLLRGLDYSQIESNPKEPFTETQLERIKDRWKDSM